ncbi:MAG: type II toxin-antitoxin system HicA family toxin [Thermoanaerobacterales bacterium]|nr:type II toxin-antitoxin system HicA family toxin [Thermoanaerobacterales bacterium]
MPPTFGQLKKFCEKNGWYLIRNTDHWYYEKVLSNGIVLRTRVSHSVGKEIPGHLWRKILKQLQVTEDEFYRNL